MIQSAPIPSFGGNLCWTGDEPYFNIADSETTSGIMTVTVRAQIVCPYGTEVSDFFSDYTLSLPIIKGRGRLFVRTIAEDMMFRYLMSSVYDLPANDENQTVNSRIAIGLHLVTRLITKFVQLRITEVNGSSEFGSNLPMNCLCGRSPFQYRAKYQNPLSMFGKQPISVRQFDITEVRDGYTREGMASPAITIYTSEQFVELLTNIDTDYRLIGLDLEWNGKIKDAIVPDAIKEVTMPNGTSNPKIYYSCKYATDTEFLTYHSDIDLPGLLENYLVLNDKGSLASLAKMKDVGYDQCIYYASNDGERHLMTRIVLAPDTQPYIRFWMLTTIGTIEQVVLYGDIAKQVGVTDSAQFRTTAASAENFVDGKDGESAPITVIHQGAATESYTLKVHNLPSWQRAITRQLVLSSFVVAWIPTMQRSVISQQTIGRTENPAERDFRLSMVRVTGVPQMPLDVNLPVPDFTLTIELL